MKKILIIFIVMSSLFISSCKLDTVPEDFIAAQFYYTTEAQCDLALTGIYDKMNYQFAALIGINFDTADEMWAYGTTDAWTNVFYSSNSDVSAFWQILYDGIERANMLLAKIDDAQITDQTHKNRIKGEAKFLRAFYYFMLVQNWGDVPFKTKPTASATDIYYPRTPASEIYDFIYKEMVEAEGLVRPVTEYTYAERVSQSTVQGVLARVCLYMAGFPNNNTAKYKDALTWSEKVIQSGFHSLNPDYKQVFINLIQDKYDLKESIWEIGFKATSVADPYYEFGEIGNLNGISQTIVTNGMASGSFWAHWFLWWKYAPGDTRRDWAIAPFTYQGNNTLIKVPFDTTLVYNNRNIGKYRREYELTPAGSKQKRANGTNWPLLRYSDILLMAAEAENELNGPTVKALQYLNTVRARAQASLFMDIPSKEAFRTILQDERSRELCFEGFRKQDLKRWKIMIPTMKALAVYVRQTCPNSTIIGRACLPLDNVTEQHYYFPIPLREMNLNKLLTQNPGW